MTSRDRDRTPDLHPNGHAFARTEPSPAPPMRLGQAPELVLVASANRPARFDRDDLVMRKGQYALRNGHMTPQASMVEDLLASVTRSTTPTSRSSSCAATMNARSSPSTAPSASSVARAFGEAFANEPFYATTLAPTRAADADAVLLADGRLSPQRKPTVLRLYRPRIEPIGRLRYGSATAVQLEFWRFGDDLIEAPIENALMRRTLPRSEAIDDVVHLHGRDWPTLEHMFAPLATDVDFEIDMVFSWVDGSSDEFVRERAKRMQSYVVGEGDDSDARFRQIDELKYALRSVHLFAPWVRRIFIATDSPAPSWLAKHPKVTIVRSEEMFADTSVLPTHNSHAVESQLHHIDGLAEHFLYSNDDMFFGRPVSPDLFFSPGGITKFVEASTRIGLGASDPDSQRVRERRAGQPGAPARSLREGHHPSPRALRGTAAEERPGAARGSVPRGVRAHRGEPVPFGDRYLGDELAVPLLRAAHRARGRADRCPRQVRRDHAASARCPRCGAC